MGSVTIRYIIEPYSVNIDDNDVGSFCANNSTVNNSIADNIAWVFAFKSTTDCGCRPRRNLSLKSLTALSNDVTFTAAANKSPAFTVTDNTTSR